MDKWGNVRNYNPFKKIKHRKRFPNYKTWVKFGMDKKINDYNINPEYEYLFKKQPQP